MSEKISKATGLVQQSKQRMRQRTSKYFVLRKMIWNKRKFYPGDIVVLPSWAAQEFWFAGVISDPPPIFAKGKLRSPLDARFNPNRIL
jgi:hypothetical protein